MRRVAGVFPRKVHPGTLAAAIGVAALWVAAAFYVAGHIVSVPSSDLPRAESIAAEPVQTPNRAAKAAREPIRKEVRLAPEIAAPKPESASPPSEVTAPHPTGSKAARAETGHASWYDLDSSTASGEPMDPGALTAAHPSLPLGTEVKVANLDNGRAVVVRINDRGPFVKGRIIDVSKAAAEALDMIEAGVAQVSVSPIAETMAGNAETVGETRPLGRQDSPR